jgi:hypothetical protein
VAVGGRVHAVQSGRVTLEDLFMRLVGGGGGGESRGPGEGGEPGEGAA